MKRWAFFRKSGTVATGVALPNGLMPLESGEALLNRADRQARLAEITEALAWPVAEVAHRLHPVLIRFAGFVQQLPACRETLVIDQGLQTVLEARLLHQTVPSTGMYVGEAARRFQYALITATLLRQTSDAITSQAITRYDATGGVLGVWNPLTGPMMSVAQAVYYRNTATASLSIPGLSTWLVPDILPAPDLSWLWQDEALRYHWLAVLNEPRNDKAIGHLLRSIEQPSMPTASVSPETAATTDPDHTPLRDILLTALRVLLANDSQFPLNDQQAWGWRVGEHLYVVGKQVAQQLRERSDLQPHRDRLGRNVTLYQTLASQQITVPAPDKPIFNVQIADEAWKTEAAVLKIPLPLIWEEESAWPAPFTGTVTEKLPH